MAAISGLWVPAGSPNEVLETIERQADEVITEAIGLRANPIPHEGTHDVSARQPFVSRAGG